MRYLKEEK